MENRGLVSIITPAFNSSRFIRETIESILAQTYPYWELLITDDCSTDDTVEIVEQYVDRDPRIKLFRLESNSGAGVCRNRSIQEAQGRFIAFCDSDDCWKPEKLERQLAFMIENGYQLTYTSYDIINEDGENKGKVNCLKRLSYLTLLRDNGIGCLTAIYDTEKLGKVFMPTIRKRQDWCLWLSIIKRTRFAFGLRESLALYRDRKGSISSNKVEMLKHNFRVYHEVEKYNSIASAILLTCYFLPYYFYKKAKQKFNK